MNILWSIGKALQLLALLIVGLALVVGLQSNDAFQELKMMLSGVFVFLVGYFIVQFVEGRK